MTFQSFIFQALANFVGSFLAAVSIAFLGYLFWRILRYPGFRVGASWTFEGWSVQAMGRFPNESDSSPMRFKPNINVTSYDDSVKKVIHTVWVRERADVFDPGKIWGQRNLQRDDIGTELRTTGGDPVILDGPIISAPASQFHAIVNCPVFVQTSDGNFYKAESIGNTATGITRFRYRCKNALYEAKRQYVGIKKLIRQKLNVN